MDTYEWLTAGGTIATAIATSLLAYFAFKAFGASVEQLKMLSADSARQTRPYVNIDLSPGLHGIGFWDITIENLGRSIARNVVINAGSLVPKDKDDHISERLSEFLATPLTLPPGAKRRVMWRMEGDEDAGTTVAGADGVVEVDATYVDDSGQPFEDHFTIASEGYAAVAPAPTVGPKVSGGGRTKGEESLANIERALRTLNTHVGMLRK